MAPRRGVADGGLLDLRQVANLVTVWLDCPSPDHKFHLERTMSISRDILDGYIKRVKELSDHVRGNEQATKQSLIGPFFSMLGYDLTDPRECIPEYKADFGQNRSTKPIDWAFKQNGAFAFFVEAKEVGKKLAGYDEQLADYFAKETSVKLGILTNGAQWRFFTDVENPNVMDKEPFCKWDITLDQEPPVDVITLLQKSQFNPELIRTYAQRQRNQNLLVNELNRLLEPSAEFTKLAIANIETRNLIQSVVESWKPIVAGALNEWAKQRMLTAALTLPAPAPTDAKPESKIETTQEELEAFEAIKRLLGAECPVGYEDTTAYFKVHIAERRTWVIARLYLMRKQPVIWFPLGQEIVSQLCPGRQIAYQNNWSVVSIEPGTPMSDLSEAFKAAYSAAMKERRTEDPGQLSA